MCNSMSAAPSSSAFVVLLVDDDLRTSRRLADMLREDGFAVEIARDGAAAVARLSQSPTPDAVVTELTTAHADGVAIGRFARSQRAGLPVPVVTNFPNPLRPDALAEGPPPFLFTKPVDYSALRECLRSASLESESQPTNKSAPAEDLSPSPRLESSLDHADRIALSGAQTVRALRRP